MDGLPVPPPARIATALAIAAGAAAGIATIALAGAGSLAPAPGAARIALETAHLPPLLRIPGEHVRLRFDAFCVGLPEGAEEDAGCSPTGSVFARSASSWVELPLRQTEDRDGRHLVADVPDDLASARSGFSYYALIHEGDASAVVPPGGESAPYESIPLERAVRVDLGSHAFGSTRRPDEKVASAAWGTGREQVGLEQGRTQAPIGASAFDVDRTGRVYLLDEARHRVLEWARPGARPDVVPVSVSGTIADLAVGSDGSLYVLETVAETGRRPFVRRFDDGGRELESIEAAERSPSQIRLGPDGPLVLEQPAQQWMPVMPGGVPAGRAEQRGRGSSSRDVPGGRTLTVLRAGNEIRIALRAGSGVVGAWRVLSASDLAEVQLAEPLGDGVVVVVRVYRDDRDEFLALVLDDRGLVRRFALAPSDWAEAAPLGRFKLSGASLYRLGSSPSGVFVDRFDLGVRS